MASTEPPSDRDRATPLYPPVGRFIQFLNPAITSRSARWKRPKVTQGGIPGVNPARHRTVGKVEKGQIGRHIMRTVGRRIDPKRDGFFHTLDTVPAGSIPSAMTAMRDRSGCTTKSRSGFQRTSRFLTAAVSFKRPTTWLFGAL